MSLLRLSPFDTTTEQGRSQERYRRVVLTLVTSILTKGVIVLTALVSVPLTLSYLGTERYGLWMTATSVTVMLGFADLGMGNGLTNAISESSGRADRDVAGGYVSSAFFMLLGVAVLILVAFTATYALVPWPAVFNVASEAASQEAGATMAVLVICLAASMPLGVAQRVQIGYQEAFHSYLWQTAGAVLGLAGILLGIQLRADLPWLVLASAGSPVLAGALNCVVLFYWMRPWLRPSLARFEWDSGLRLAGSGLLFLLVTAMYLIGNASDSLVIAQSLGASAVASYAVTQKLFSTVLLAQHLYTPLWPAFGEAMARSDFAWAWRTLGRSLTLSVGFAVAAALPLLALGQTIVAVWAGRDVVPPVSLLAGFAAWVVLSSYTSVMSALLNNTTLLGRHAWCYSVASVAALILKVALAPLWQASGVIWGTVLAYTVLYVAPSAVIARRALRVDPASQGG